jgi:diphthine synthase
LSSHKRNLFEVPFVALSMGRLVFVGLGLWDADDMSVRARRVLQEADEVVAEFYTSHLFGTSLESLAEVLGRPLEVLPREGVESGRDAILARCDGDRTVAFVTAGDALTATTHQDLRLAAIDAGLEVEIVHGVSIKTAAPGLLGLSDYKFGRTTTMVFPEPRFFPESPLDVVLENRDRGLHTLVLLDIRADEGRYMSAAEGARVLLETLKRRSDRGEGVAPERFGPESMVCVVARAGSPEPLLAAGPLRALATGDHGPPLHCLVVPGRLSDEEATVLARTTGFDGNEGTADA